MDDLIPFLIVVLISIIGAASRRKKKRPISDSIVEKEPARRNDDFLGWMERLVDDEPLRQPNVEDEIVEAEEVIPEATVAKNVSAPGLYDKYAGFISPAEHDKLVNSEGQSLLKTTEEEVAEKTIKDDEVGKEPESDDFDLRRAVIFSTILERKYD